MFRASRKRGVGDMTSSTAFRWRVAASGEAGRNARLFSRERAQVSDAVIVTASFLEI